MFEKLVGVGMDIFNVIRGKGSFKTGYAGIALALAAVLQWVVAPLADGNPATGVVWDTFATQLTIALGIYVSRDDDKSSEDVQIK